MNSESISDLIVIGTGSAASAAAHECSSKGCIILLEALIYFKIIILSRIKCERLICYSKTLFNKLIFFNLI
jgi:hypothetical protein